MPDRGDLTRLDISVPHPARVYDVLLGGKDNFAADRAAAKAELAVRYLAAEAGMRGFLDIGTGLPSPNSTHEVAQSVARHSRVVYVDNDPIVLAHARALLKSEGPGGTGYVDADLRDPGKILSEAATSLDFSEPVAVMLIGIMHFIPDEDRPYEIVATLLEAVPPGSYLAMSHQANDLYPEEEAEFAHVWNAQARETERLCSVTSFTGIFGGALKPERVARLPVKTRPEQATGIRGSRYDAVPDQLQCPRDGLPPRRGHARRGQCRARGGPRGR